MSTASVINTEKGVVRGSTLVSPKTGLPIDTIIDQDGKTRLLVEADVTISSPTINIDIQASTNSIALKNSSSDEELLINPDGSILTRIIQRSNPGQLFLQNSAEVSLATFTNIFSFVVEYNGTNIKLIEVSGGVTSLVRLVLNGVPIRNKRLNLFSPNIEFLFLEPRTVNIGDILIVECKPDKAVPSFLASSTFYTALQGFVE